MDLQLTDKVVLITGGAKGIGAAIARACANEGAVPVVVDRDTEAVKKLEEELRRRSLKIKGITAELSDVEACRQVVEGVLKNFGRVDALINNAGVNDRVGLEDGSPEKYRESLKRNLLHYYDIAHFCLKSLKESAGSILNIASKTALTGQGGTSGYASSKGAILALTREWAAELSPYGIRVNAIVPAEVMTPLYRQWVDSFPNPEEKLKAIISKIPLGKRMTHVDEIAAVAVFLISGRAGHITGQHLFVDGGYVHLDRALT
jgi:L-fucose dehydrogenase